MLCVISPFHAFLSRVLNDLREQIHDAQPQELVNLGVPLDDVDDRGDQAMHYAAAAGSIEAIALFHSKGISKCVPGEGDAGRQMSYRQLQDIATISSFTTRPRVAT